MNPSLTGKTIAKLRKQVGLTQASLAQKMGVSDKAVSKWERGLSCPDVSLWNSLSIILDTDIESLLYGDEGKNNWIGVLFLDDSVNPDTLIFDKPLIYYLLSQFLLVGINKIYIIGKCEPIDLPNVDIVVLSELNHQFTSNVFCIYGNHFIYGPNLTKHFKRAMSRKDKVTAIVSMKGKGNKPVFIDQNRVIKQSKELLDNQYYVEPYVFYPCGHFSNKDNLNYIGMNAETMVRGMAIFNVNNFNTVNEMSNYIRIMQQLNGEKIGDLLEILRRRGIDNLIDVNKF